MAKRREGTTLRFRGKDAEAVMKILCAPPLTVAQRIDKITRDTCIEEIRAERYRQIIDEGFDAEHDDAHDEGELALVAACYALNAACLLHPMNGNALELERRGDFYYIGDILWPWAPEWWKPARNLEEAGRDMVRAGALLVAQLEQIHRARQRKIEAAK